MKSWEKVNRDLIAKAIGELCYEQILQPQRLSRKNSSGLEVYSLQSKTGVNYLFAGWMSVWDYLRVDSHSIERLPETENLLEAAQFFVDFQSDLGIKDLVMGPFLEEMGNTLYSDLTILKKNEGVSVGDLLPMSSVERQSHYNGHPKILLNKGRVGWSSKDVDNWSPERGKEVQFLWLAAHRDCLILGEEIGIEYQQCVAECLTIFEIQQFQKDIHDRGLDFNEYVFLPVHPWQYDRFVKVQFQSDFQKEKLLFLGEGGDFYRPQVSVRTFSNSDRPLRADVKVAMSLLNTSAIRGLPGKYIEEAPVVSKKLRDICQNDPILNTRKTRVLKEMVGASYRHPFYSQVQGAPYRYQEYLGVIFRESPASQLEEGEQVFLTAGLFHKDADGSSLLGALQKQSGLSMEKWLRQYFDKVIVSLYHLQLKYGIGLVAHGQNVLLVTRDGVPSGVILKDFQGDLRFSEDSQIESLFKSPLKSYQRLPAEYLIHDLITGHFVTVLRFISTTLQEADGFPETKFYNILRETIVDYLLKQEITEIDREKNLLNETYKRVLLNKVRFTIGYADSEDRPVPMLGRDLKNPLNEASFYG